MICAVIASDPVGPQLETAARLGADLAEIRLDYLSRPEALWPDAPLPILATCRPTWAGGRFSGDEPARAALLTRAAQQAAYVDLELGFESQVASPAGCQRVISFHDFDRTPADLPELAARIADAGADLIKIACQVGSYADVNRLLALPALTDRPTVAIGMGPAGILTRVAYRKFGAAMTYAPLTEGTAPGQIGLEALLQCYRADRIGPQTRLFGLIGSPTEHSSSPAVHNRAFAEQDLDACYLPLEVTDLADFMAAWAWDLDAVSVTMPLKQQILPYLDQVEPGVDAVNTVLRRDGQLHGSNTDGPGALEALREAGVPGHSALILGAGGAARTIGSSLRAAGVELTVCARRPEQAAGLQATVLPWDARADVTADWLINTTPIGMAPEAAASPMPASALQRFKLVFDAVYKPAQTRLLADAEAAGCAIVSGQRMFDAQAAQQFTLFRSLLR